MSGEPILELTDVSADAGAVYDVGLEAVSLRLAPGALAFSRLADGESHTPLADVIEGLTATTGGTVSFLGRSWSERPAADAARDRGRIGRVFPGSGWISALDMDENITLGQQHHAGRAFRDVAAEAAQLAEQFGLDPLRGRRPVELNRHELHVAQWVRAFLGTPDLVILERPLHSVHPGAAEPLHAAIGAARGRGAAVLWIDFDGAAGTIADDETPEPAAGPAPDDP